MLRFRNVPKESIQSDSRKNGFKSAESANRMDENDVVAFQPEDDSKRRKTSYAPPLPLIILVLWCMVQSALNFRFLLRKNLGLSSQSSNTLRGLSTTPQHNTTNTNNGSACPSLPDRLLHHHVDLLTPPIEPLTKEQVDRQLMLMKKDQLGTMKDIILTCPDHHRPKNDPSTRKHQKSPLSCRGVLKKYQSKTVYHHVKRILTVLADTGIVPRILYSNDKTFTLVEEDKGWLTMRNSPIPIDFDQQLRRILCILQQHSIIHRDLTYPNFIIDEITGMIYLIDMGDAFIAKGGVFNIENYNWRNLQNLFTVWLRQYDEESRLEEFISTTLPAVEGDRQWRPPAKQWTSLNQNKVGSLFLSQELIK